jgi:PAS domain S-box-containing protein
MPLRNMPIRRKVTVVTLFTCCLVLLLACGSLAVYQVFHYRNSLVETTTVLANILSKNTEAALSFQDENAAGQNLAALAAESSIDAACVYSADGKVFASYSRGSTVARFPSTAPDIGYHFDSGSLVVVRPVELNGRRIGTILLQAGLQAMYKRLRVLGLVTVLMVLGSCVLALALVTPMQRSISVPIATLTKATRAIAAGKDYTVRLPDVGRDETGSLAAAFNQLLADIEERDKALSTASNSLRNNETRLKAVVENLTEGLVVADVNGNLLHFNCAALELHGFANMDECRLHFSKLKDTLELSGMDGKVWTLDQWPISRIMRDEKVQNLEARIRLPKRGRRIFNYGGSLVRNDDGSPAMVVVTMTDITERKQYEQKILEQLSRMALLTQIARSTGERLDLQSIFQVVVRTVEDQLPVDFCCIGLHDPASKSLTIAHLGTRSQTFANELAMNREASIAVDENGLSRCVNGHLVYEPDVTGSPHAFPRRLIRAGLKAFVASPLVIDSQAFGILIAARCQPDSFSSGECEFLRQLSDHVALAGHQAQLHTALQQAYDDLRQTQQAVMQQERLRALGQMASGIAHDINNAISPVALYTESLLENEPNLSPRARDYLQTIQRSIEDVAHTVARMREFYRQRETQLTLLPMQVNPLLQQVADLSCARWSDMPQQRGQVINLSMELAPDLPPIIGVESEVREALLNLVFNAVDAMPDGGKLTMRTRPVHKGDTQENGHASFVAIEIADTGMGMDDDTRRRCVEPFFTTKGERGTGLGLAMVYGIAQRHGAEIEIDSEVGKGSTFRLIFPASAAAAPAEPTSTAAVLQKRLRLLVIDDDPLLIKSLRDILEKDGHVVVTANGGEAGIKTFESAKTNGEKFDLVITDLGMPYVDGRKVAAAIKEMSPSTPVVLLTGWGQRLVAEGEVPPHVDKVLNKPPKLRELRETLAALPAAKA